MINAEDVTEDAYSRDKYEHFEEDKTKRNMLVDMLRKRVVVDERNNILLVTGQTGSGKSYSAISIAFELDNTFDETRICFSAQEFMEVINKDLPAGSCIILDEAGVSINSRMFMTTVNRLIGYVNQTMRKKRWTVFFCVPDLSFVDINVRKLAHFLMESVGVNKQNGIASFKIFNIKVMQRTGKIYYIYPIVEGGSQLKKVGVKLAPERIINKYEENKTIFINELNKKVLKDIIKKIKEDDLTALQRLVYDMRKSGKSVEEIRVAAGFTTTQTVFNVIRAIERKMGKLLQRHDNVEQVK